MREFWVDTSASKKRKVCWMTKNKKDFRSSEFTTNLTGEEA
jgi:hypothetical protein